MSTVYKGNSSNIKFSEFSELPNYIKVQIATHYTTGNFVPSGGLKNQVLSKNSNTSFDTHWSYLPNLKLGSKSYNGSEDLELSLLDLCELVTNSDIDKLFKEV